jgi:hypothetical protein
MAELVVDIQTLKKNEVKQIAKQLWLWTMHK